MAFKRAKISLPCGYGKFIQSLSKEIAEPSFFSNSEKLFKGEIKNDVFKIWQNKMLRGYEAITYGRCDSQDGKEVLQLFTRIPIPAIAITIIWYAYILFQVITNNSDSMFFSIASLCAPIVLIAISFFPDARDSEAKLKKIIENLAQNL